MMEPEARRIGMVFYEAVEMWASGGKRLESDVMRWYFWEPAMNR